MNKLNYLLALLIMFFIVSSIFIKPQSFSSYFDLDIDATIPEESISEDTEKKNMIPFDIDIFNAAIEEQEKGSISNMDLLSSWTVEVEEYKDKETLMADFIALKERGLKAYIQYKEDQENRFVLYIGPTIDREDSQENLAKISDLTQFSPKIIPYD